MSENDVIEEAQFLVDDAWACGWAQVWLKARPQNSPTAAKVAALMSASHPSTNAPDDMIQAFNRGNATAADHARSFVGGEWVCALGGLSPGRAAAKSRAIHFLTSSNGKAVLEKAYNHDLVVPVRSVTHGNGATFRQFQDANC